MVNDYFFKPDGNVEEGKAAAAELAPYFNAEIPEVQLTLWLVLSAVGIVLGAVLIILGRA